jgi:hypothetical protein
MFSDWFRFVYHFPGWRRKHKNDIQG